MTPDPKPRTAKEWAAVCFSICDANGRAEAVERIAAIFDQAMAQAREPLERELADLEAVLRLANRNTHRRGVELARIKSATEILTIDHTIQCKNCSGSGYHNGSGDPCVACDGSGHIEVSNVWIPAEKHQQVVDRARSEALEEAAKALEIPVTRIEYLNGLLIARDRIRALKAKAE